MTLFMARVVVLLSHSCFVLLLMLLLLLFCCSRRMAGRLPTLVVKVGLDKRVVMLPLSTPVVVHNSPLVLSLVVLLLLLLLRLLPRYRGVSNVPAYVWSNAAFVFRVLWSAMCFHEGMSVI